MFYNCDLDFFKVLGRESQLSVCSKCDKIGHKEPNCIREIVFSDLENYYRNYNK